MNQGLPSYLSLQQIVLVSLKERYERYKLVANQHHDPIPNWPTPLVDIWISKSMHRNALGFCGQPGTKETMDLYLISNEVAQFLAYIETQANDLDCASTIQAKAFCAFLCPCASKMP
jgi:hypothetical protein